jgi:general secretion pathway protein J
MMSRPASQWPAASAATGFTLIEVLVAMTVMAIMAVMAWQGVDGIVRTRDATQSRLEKTLRLNTVIAQWDQDLAAIQDSSVVPQALSCDGATVRLTRRTPTGLQIVAWSLRADGDQAAWVRWASPAVTTTGALQENWLRSLQLQDNEPGAIRALTGLSAWQVYFYQGNAWANCQSSGDVAAAPPPASAASAVAVRTLLPKGVRVVLSFAPSSGVGGDLTRDTLVGP